ncbi:MAG: glycine--tRNA ligase subunit beta, partial [Actinobacteria bacterium]|nr:glycine--tRNA ligase subunit beta [Actinomycetota bacterium]
RGQGVAVADLVVREDPDAGRDFVWAEQPGDDAPLADLVPEIARRVLEGLRFGKTMRWGDGRGRRFSRPVRWITAKAGTDTVEFEVAGIPGGGTSMGHRFLGGPVQVGSADSYRDDLRASFVIADHHARREAIIAGLDAAAAAAGASWDDPAGKIEEVVHLVEWPSVITGRIAEQHLALPERVLVTAMQSHQRYMPLHSPDGALVPAFLAVSNGDPAAAEIIIRGNEDVLDARLQDAVFSYERDVAAGLEQLDGRLDDIVFHVRLGTLADKRDRLRAGVADIWTAAGIPAGSLEVAEEAAALAKVDQGAILVAEFSELQGFAASHYARLAGRSDAVADAIAEQYLPEGPDSPVPATEAGALLACAEKVDNLVGAFLIGELPSGSKDPYGLRRAAAGLVRVAIERGWGIVPAHVLEPAMARFRAQGADLELSDADALAALEDFIADRLAHHLGQEGVPQDAVRAAIAVRPGGLAVTAAWARALHEHRDDGALVRAGTGANRCRRSIAGSEYGLGGFTSAGDGDEDALAAALDQADAAIAAARAGGDPAAAIAAAEALGGPVDAFFEALMVNADDPAARDRRHALVRRAGRAYGQVADFEVLVLKGGE